jgi:hypothetical protein
MNFPKIEKMSSNRSFGLVFFVVFLLIALWPIKFGETIRTWALLLSVIFLFLGILNSKILYPLNKLWNYLGIFLGVLVSPIVMGIIFFLIVTPTGLIMRLFRKDLLRLKKKDIKSYWINKEKIKTSMKNQF